MRYLFFLLVLPILLGASAGPRVLDDLGQLRFTGGPWVNSDEELDESNTWLAWDNQVRNPALDTDFSTAGWPKTYGRMCVTFTAGPSGTHRTIIDSRTEPDDPRPYLSVVDDGRIRFGIPTVGSIEGGTVIPGQAHIACIDLTLGTTTLTLDGRTIGTSTTLKAWEWPPTTRLGSRYDGADPLGGIIASIQWRGLRLVCDMRSDTCSDGRRITTRRDTPVPCEVFPGMWEMVLANTGCYSVRGLEVWYYTQSYLSYGAELDRSPWQAVAGATVQSLPTGGYRVSGVGEGSSIFQLIQPYTGNLTFACVADTGASIGARLRVNQVGGSGGLICDLDSVPGFKTHFCTTNITGTPMELAVQIYPGSGHVDVVGCWLNRASITGRPCWGGGAPIDCGSERHTISTEGWPTESGEISLVYTPQGAGVTTIINLLATTGSGGGQPSGFYLYRTYGSGALVLGLRRGNTTSVQSTQGLVWEIGRSYHIRLRWSPERAEIWRDGVLLHSWVPTAVPDSHPGTAYIGTNTGGGGHAQGAIRDLRIRSYEETQP